MNDIKVLHLMKNLADSDGIPSFPCYIPFYLDNKIYINNNIILTRDFIQPNIYKINKSPPIKRLTSKLTIIREIIFHKPNILIIYHHFGSTTAFILIIISKLLDIKTIAQADINEYGVPRLHKSVIKTIRDILRWLLIYPQLIFVDKIVGATKYEISVLSNIRKMPENKYEIIPWGTNFDLNTSKKEEYILMVSKWWRDRKNLHSALSVFSEVIKEKDSRLVIIGKFIKGNDNEFESMYGEKITGEEYEAKIMRLIEDLGIKDHVEFTGVVSSGELQSLYRHARVYYMPTKFETFGGVFVEAMASGTPIVAMKNSAVQYVVEDGVTGFLRDTEEGQKEAILKLFSDEALYREMQENCLREAERYKWENVIMAWEDLLDELLEKN